jgi:hypothetical protein
MKRNPLTDDQNKIGIFKLVSILEKQSQTPGVQATNKEGTLKWTCQVLHQPPVENGYISKAGLEEITLTLNEAPSIAPLTEVRFHDLTCQYWNFGGKSGLSMSASGISPVATKSSRQNEVN